MWKLDENHRETAQKHILNEILIEKNRKIVRRWRKVIARSALYVHWTKISLGPKVSVCESVCLCVCHAKFEQKSCSKSELALVSAGSGSILGSFWSKLGEKVICSSDDVSCFNHVSEKEGCAPPPPVNLVRVVCCDLRSRVWGTRVTKFSARAIHGVQST